VKLTWTAPQSDGGAEIVQYAIQYKEERSIKWEQWVRPEQSPALCATVTKLQENTVYEFRVAAENKVGQGPYSDPSEPVKTPIVGDEPQLLQPLSDVMVISPEVAVFEAKIDGGKPRAEITWYKGSKQIKADSRIDTSFEGDSAKLEIRKTEAADAGDYKVKAVNKVGEFTSEAALTVYGKQLVLIHKSYFSLIP
jgi:titin